MSESMPHPNSTVAIYARVSSEEQDLTGQIRDLVGWCDNHHLSYILYSEKITATGKDERAEYDRLLRAARDPNREFGQVLVWCLDRWSRDIRFTKAIESIENLEALGIKFHSYKEPMIDTPIGDHMGTDSIGRDLLRAILPIIATFESRRKAERVRVAMREIKEGRRQTRSGIQPGRPRRVTPEKLAQITKLRAEGKTWPKVAQIVGLPAGTCSAAWSHAKRNK